MNKHISIMGALPALVMFLLLAGCGGGGGGGGGGSASGNASGDTPSLGNGPAVEVSEPAGEAGQTGSTNTDTVIGPGANSGVDSSAGSSVDPGTGSGSDSSTVTWLPPTMNVDDSAFTDLVGYKIYIGSEPGRFEIVRELKEPGVSEYVLEGLPAGKYYVGMTAVNSQNIESPLSNVVVRTVGGS